MSDLQFGILGPLEVRRNGELVSIAAPKQRALLGLLLLRANQPVAQDELIDQLWGEDAPPSVRASLQNLVHALRKILGSSVLERHPAGYVLHVEPGELDLERFERLVADARRVGATERAAKLRDALACWRGTPLVEFPTEPFAQHAINRLEEERLTALEERIDADLELGHHADLVPELEDHVDSYPLRERFWAQFMLALYRAGRQADALAAYRRAHHTFVDELGVEPGVVLRELQRAILVQDPALDDDKQKIGSTLERAAAILPMEAKERATSLYDYGVALLRTGELRRGASTIAAAERMAAAVGETAVAERARLYISYTRIWTEGKSVLEHLDETQRSAQRFAELEDDEGLWMALRQQAQMLCESGSADEALEVSKRCADLAAQAGNPWWQALTRSPLAQSLVAGSTPVETAIAWCESELLAMGSDDRGPSPLNVWCALILLQAQVGRIEKSRGLSEQAIEWGRRRGHVGLFVRAMGASGAAEFSVANLAAAAAHHRSAYAVCETEEDHALFPEVAAELACVLAHSGDVREARELALAARARNVPDAFYAEVLWRRTLALVAAHEGSVDEALRLSEEAWTRAAASDWLTFRGQTLEEAATIRQLAGDDVGARDALDEALANYEKKGNLVGAERVRGRIEQDTL